jgi:hypothetical protein
LSDIGRLTPFCPSAKKDHKPFAIAAKVDTVSRAPVDAPLENTLTDRACVTKIPGFNPSYGRENFLRSLRMQIVEPG